MIAGVVAPQGADFRICTRGPTDAHRVSGYNVQLVRGNHNSPTASLTDAREGE